MLIQINLYWAILQTYLALERSLKRERCRTRKEKKTERFRDSCDYRRISRARKAFG